MDADTDWAGKMLRERNAIDAVDHEIVELLNTRAKHAKAIGNLKSEKGHECYSPAREVAVLDRVFSHNQGPLMPKHLKDIYREIIAACRSLERQHRVAFLGPDASFTQVACQKHFGSSVTMEPLSTIPDVFAQVEQDKADFGVVPIENSTEGAVTSSLDNFVTTQLRICAETYLPIHLCLLSRYPLECITKIYSHPHVPGQCQVWLSKHLPHVPVHSVSSTARGAELAKTEEGAAAIGTDLASQVYELDILQEHIEDNTNNRTRFLVIGKIVNRPTGRDKTSIVLSVPHQPGALHRAIGYLDAEDVNMTMIQSRPTRVMPWEYLFFIDFQGHEEDAPVARVLDALRSQCPFVKTLGSYPDSE